MNWSNYYQAPTYDSINPMLSATLQESCTKMIMRDISYWSNIAPHLVDVFDITIYKWNTATGTYDTAATWNIGQSLYTQLSGTITGTGGAYTITGAATTFLTDFEEGDYIYIESLEKAYKIASIQSDTALTLQTFLDGNIAGADYGIAFEEVIATLSNDAAWADGLYRFDYNINMISGDVYSNSQELFFYCGIHECYNNIIKDIPNRMDCNACDFEYIKAALVMRSMMVAMETNMQYGNFSECYRILEVMNNMCNMTNCNCS